MISKCANPACGTPFNYLREGKLFHIELVAGSGQKPARKVEHFWLCDRCAPKWTLTRDSSKHGVIVMPLKTYQRAAAS